MNAAVALGLNSPTKRQPEPPANRSQVNSLLFQLDHYRRQTAWLAMVNKLQGRLAGATDLAGMLDAFSVWLMPLVEHDLVAFRNADHSREHILCSSHGPRRRQMLELAEEFLGALLTEQDAPCRRQGDFHGCRWRLDFADDHGLLLVMRQQSAFDRKGLELLTRVVDILVEPLQRGLEYENLFDQARRDFLTGLANRRVFDERITPIMDSARRYGHPLTLLSMDLDSFKELNDTYGHVEGDNALRRVAATLMAMVRTSDLLVRMGGDEFLLVMPDSDLRAAKVLAKRICHAVGALNFGAGSTRGHLGISIGISPWAPPLPLSDWLQRADEALYQAKSVGSCWVCLPSGRSSDMSSG